MSGPFPYPQDDPRAHGVEELHRLHSPEFASIGHPDRMGVAGGRTEERPNPSRGWGVVGVAVIAVTGIAVAAMLIAMAIVLAA
ncbi:DUF6480 family protein [Yinghuangia sp. ASG 101]|uniref:DUF6480 family protein n=1 Tax=Yinghuangia sp. ASG 101 TaxID=2896848 RepID=UPI001E4F876E|nr:DUF6480 family protein [Yinghuangia sp. ASG 101]UGQ12234.1 DUF6480 family protein [Yinghuangia sp. ASG 101]